MSESPVNKLRTRISTGENGFYRIEVEGEAGAAAVAKIIGEIAVFPDSKKELWVATNLKFDLSNAEIIAQADLAKQMNKRATKVAIVASDDLNYGLARVYAGHRETKENQLTVFRDEESALKWLELESNSVATDQLQLEEWEEAVPSASSQ